MSLAYAAPTRAYLKSSVSFGRPNFTRVLGFGLLMALPSLAIPAFANPVGGQISTGAATISTNGNSTSVKQTSEGVVINWSSFNIGNGQTTQFYQPNAQALAVNRIGSKNASQILGTLDANGNVVLINGNGLLFGKNARVNVGSLVATSTDGTDSDLLSGKFTKTGSQSATIVNHGVITVGTQGTVALVAPNVTNTGIVNAKLGTVSLGAANKFTVDLNGDGLVSFAAQGDVNGKASVINKGRLVGANVSMTAHAAEGIATGVVNTSGVIVAQGAHEVGGSIVLDAGDGGSIDISGGKLEAKGPKGGGTITVGSWNNASVAVNNGAVLNASATKTGNGGHIQVVSNSASFTGNALAQGGIVSGNGGLIETSGHTLDFLGSSINASATHGKAGTWLLDPDDLTIDSADATEISNTLGSSGSGTNVSLQTTSSGCSGGFGTCVAGSGDINIEGAISWGSSATLSLDAYHSLNILAPITVNGAGQLALQYNDEDTDGALSFGLDSAGFAGSVSYGKENKGGALSINGASYTLLYSMTNVQNMNSTGNNALATSLNAASISNYSPFVLRGVFEGLGNTISNLKIDLPSDAYVGLFSESNGTVRDFGLVGGSVDGLEYVGALVGENVGEAAVIDSFASTPISGGNGTNVYADFGGLVGVNDGVIENSYATGAVSGTFYVGGLAGANGSNASISNSYATGAVTVEYNEAGGLVASNGTLGTISNSYATGTVRGIGSSSQTLGGLAGENYGGSIVDSYATGAVSGYQVVGGLVGGNDSYVGDIGTIRNSYATGSVTGVANDEGGLAAESSGTITDAYATGTVHGAEFVGGLVGYNSTSDGGTITSSYWDLQTSGITDASQGVGNVSNFGGVTGLTTEQLQSDLPSGFSSSAWGSGANLFPYLLWQSPTGAPQSISGIISNGAAPVAGQNVTVEIDGTIESPALSMSSGANGYYYVLLAPGTISGGSQVLAYLPNKGGASFAEGATGSVSGLDISADTLSEFASAEDYGGVETDLATAVGDKSRVKALLNGLADLSLFATASTFTVDEAIDKSAGSITLNTAIGDNLVIDAALMARRHTVDLVSGGTIDEEENGDITTQALTGSADGTALLDGANLIDALSGFSDIGGGLEIDDARGLSVKGTVDVGDNTLTLQTTSGNIYITGDIDAQTLTLVSATKALEGKNGSIDVGLLNVTAQTGIVLSSASNDITAVGIDTTTSGPNKIKKN